MTGPRGRVLRFLAGTILSGLAALAMGADQRAYHVHVNGLACPFCAYGLERSLGNVDDVESVSVNLKTGLIKISVSDGATLDEATVREAVMDAGFTVEAFEPATRMDQQGDDT